MKTLFSVHLLVLTLGVVSLSQAAEFETVVSDRPFGSAARVVLDQKTIQESRAQNLTSLLATEANISVSNTNFQPGSIYLRGGDSSHVLILVDGVPFFDASTIQKTSSLNSIDLKSIRRVEVIKGSQSVLYGGQALTGVIKIETLPADVRSQAQLSVEGGQAQFGKISSEGVSAADDFSAVVLRGQFRSKQAPSPVDGSSQSYRNRLSSVELAPFYRGDSDLFFKFSRTDVADEIPTTGNDQKPADTADLLALQDITSLVTGWRPHDSPWTPQFTAGLQRHNRSYNQVSSSTDQVYGSQVLTVRGEASPLNAESGGLKIGLSHARENFVYRENRSEKSNEMNESTGAFAKGDLRLGQNILFEAGFRRDWVLRQPEVDTHQFGLTFFDQLRIEYSTGFKGPSLFQLYSTLYGGNPNLKAEKSRSWSLSWDKVWKSESSHVYFAGVTLFSTEFDDLIQYVGSPPTGGYVNISKSQSRGIEVGLQYRYATFFSTELNLGYQEPWDVKNAIWLIRRPLQTGSLRMSYGEQTKLSAELILNGDRLDRFWLGQVWDPQGLCDWKFDFGSFFPTRFECFCAS